MKLSLHFKHVDQEHAGLVRHWLSLPHVTPWFYGQGLQNTLCGIDAFLQGGQRAQYWLVFDKAHPFAFFILCAVKPTSSGVGCKEQPCFGMA
ncbi:MAG: hypothetical protein JSR97_06105 [Verrucomicrobia bacterium]|nr:hypothetical protein [Verrucomicrobiota bacterium]